jgi:hypothetical protein
MRARQREALSQLLNRAMMPKPDFGSFTLLAC